MNAVAKFTVDVARNNNHAAVNLARQIVLLGAFAAISLSAAVTCAEAQDFLSGPGGRRAVAPDPVEFGYVESASGQLHIEIPLASFPQRGTDKPLRIRYVYDSAVWRLLQNNQLYGQSVSSWSPQDSSRLYAGVEANGAFYDLTVGSDTCFFDFSWADADGARHFFPIKTCTNSASTGDAFATDSSGYRMYVTAGTQATVYAPDGSIVMAPLPKVPDGNSFGSEDANGNYVTWGSALDGVVPSPVSTIVVDTLGRTVLNAFGQGNCSSGASACYLVPNAQGGTSAINAVYATIPLKTQFGWAGLAECVTNCTLKVLQSLTLPDNTSYSFKYDCDSSTGIPACGSAPGQAGYYGELTTMTLPNGGQVSYAYTTKLDAYGIPARWLTSRAAPDGTWQYDMRVLFACTPSAPFGCKQQQTITKPNGDSTVYTFTMNNGAWPTQIQHFSGGTLLDTITDTYDFSIPCPLTNCMGSAYIRRLSETVTVVSVTGNITKQTKYTYDSPQTGNITATQEWKFLPGTAPAFPATPDRATYFTYYNAGPNNINRPASITHCNNSGSDPDCPGGEAR